MQKVPLRTKGMAFAHVVTFPRFDPGLSARNSKCLLLRSFQLSNYFSDHLGIL